MNNPVPEAMDLADIRQTIRQIILPLLEAIYVENPSDVILFCSGYFNNLLHQKRESCLQNININYSEDCSLKEEELANIIESKDFEVFPTNLQESASDPVLIANSRRDCVNLKGKKRSSWDAPSNILEPIKSVVFLEDAEYGIGDQHSLDENQMDLENDAKAGDTDIRLKDDSAYEDDSFSEDMIVNEIKNDLTAEEDLKPSHSCHENNEDLNALCVQFECMKSKISDASKFNGSRRENFDLDTIPKKDIKIYRKQLSPNSSFGFVPHLNEYDSEEERKKIDSEDSRSENLKTKTEEISVITRAVSQTFHGLAEKISSAETNLNDMLQNAKEISDVIPGQNNVSAMDFANKSDKISISESKDDFITEKENEMIVSSSDKHGDVTDENNFHVKKIDDLLFNLKVDDRNMPEYSEPEGKGYRETKRDYQEEKFLNKDTSVSTAHQNYDEDDRDKSVESETQTVADKLWRKRWYEAHPSLDNLNSSQRRDPRLLRTHFSARRPNIGEGGDVPLDRFYISNEASNDYMHNCSRNQITPESPTDAREYTNSRFSSDEINRKTNSERPSNKLSERKTSNEKISNANPQSIPYSWRKLCKQSHSSENMVHSKESQTKLKVETCDSSKSEREQDISSFNEAEKRPETNVNECEEIFFEASDEIHDKTNLGIKESKEGKLNQGEDKNKEDVSRESIHDQRVNITDTQQKILPETDLSVDSKDKTLSNPILSKQDASIHYQSMPEAGKETQNWKQCVTNGDREVDKKHFNHYGTSSEAQKDKGVNQNNNHPMKDEFGLNAACGCGDFVYTMNNVNEQNTGSQSNIMEPDDNIANEQSDENRGGISLEYFGEVIERVIEKQTNDSMDSYEGLDFSNDTEDDSSCVESSDFSETDDCSMNDSMQDK